MKAWKFLGAPLMLMLLSGMPWSDAFAAGDTTSPVTVNPGQNITVEDVTVADHSTAVEVYAEDGANASITVNGNVTLTNPPGGTAVYAEGNGAKASADISGNVSATTGCVGCGIESSGTRCYTLSGESTIKVGGNVSATSQTYATGVRSSGGNATVNQDVTSTGPMSSGLEIYTNEKTNIEVKGGVFASGNDVASLVLESGGYDSEHVGNLSVAVKKDVVAAATADSSTSYYSYSPWSSGVYLYNDSGQLTADIIGDVKATAPNGEATGIYISSDTYQTPKYNASYSSNSKSTVKIHGNLISHNVGIYRELPNNYVFSKLSSDGRKEINVLVENTIDANDVAVLFDGFVPLTERSSNDPKLNLTVWKIKLNKSGNAAEYIDSYIPEQLESEELRKKSDIDQEKPHPMLEEILKKTRSKTAVKSSPITYAATDFEKSIMYIVKVEQPSEGGTIRAVDANGNDLTKSFDFDVAHEGDKIMLKANLADGFKIVAAYNGEGEKEPLLKDANGNYYIVVQKGGGVYLSVELEDTTNHSYTEPDDNIESLSDDETDSLSDGEIKESNSSSSALKTGDNHQPTPWLLLSVVSMGAIAGMEICNKKHILKKTTEK